MKKLLIAVVVVAAFLAPVYARTLFAAKSALEQARAESREGHTAEALNSYRRALAWDSPLNIYAGSAAADLYDLGVYGAVDHALKLEALRALKSGLKSARSFLNPQQGEEKSELLRKVEAEIEKATAAERSAGFVREQSTVTVHYFYQFLAQLMFWLWIAAVLFLIWRGFGKDGSVIRQKLLPGILAAVVFYVVWLVALSLA